MKMFVEFVYVYCATINEYSTRQAFVLNAAIRQYLSIKSYGYARMLDKSAVSYRAMNVKVMHGYLSSQDCLFDWRTKSLKPFYWSNTK